jgi:L-asparaginase / beta-aspartyl-peptidase
MRRAAAHDVAARVAYKSMPLQDAVAEVVWGDMAPGDGGFVGVDASGDVVMDWNSQGMYHGCCSSAPGSRQVGVYAAQERARGGSTRTGSASGIQN